MGALDRLVGRVRANPRMAVAVAGGALLVAAWLGWAIYVASDRGVNQGLGVLIAWPAILTALALISLAFIGGYLLVKRLSAFDGGGEGANPSAGSEATGNRPDESPADEASEAEEESGPEDPEDGEGSESEPEAAGRR